MRALSIVGILLAALVLVALLSLGRGSNATTTAVAVTCVGYTNLPNNELRFASFSLSNQAPYAVRWRGSWVELEGNPNLRAETINPSLPGFTREPTLKARQSMWRAIGEPFRAPENGRWRYAVSYARYTWRARWLDFLVRHKLPQRFGSVELVDIQRLLNPSNNVTATSAWLTK